METDLEMEDYSSKDQENRISVGIGEYKIGKSPSIISTYLGSCIAICFYEPKQKIGAMLHIMLPTAPHDDTGKKVIRRTKYADTGISEVLKVLKETYEVDKAGLVVKIFGGAKVLKNVARNIGQENIMAVTTILKALHINIEGSQLGGEKGFRVEMRLEDGKVECKRFGEKSKEF